MKRTFLCSPTFALAAIGALLLTSVGSGNALAAPTFVNSQSPDLPDQARGIPKGGALRVQGLELQSGATVDLELTRFDVFAEDVVIDVVGGPTVAAPDTAYFRGRTSDDPGSVVMLAVPGRGKGKVHGTIVGSGGAWMMEFSAGKKAGFRNRKVDPSQDFADRSFDCGSDGLSVSGASATTATLAGSAAPSSLPGMGSPLGIKYTAHMIIDTDFEFWNQFWNLPGNTGNPSKTAAAAIAYIGDLIAYASVPYERDVDTNLLIQQVRLFPGAADLDPYSENDDFCGCDGYGKLDEVQDVWSGNATPRTLVHFISGKTEGCGCAYTGVLCSQGSGYGASSAIGTGFNIDLPGFVWEGMVIAHEIGHNFNSPHTHNYCGVQSISDPVDICVDDATDGVSNCLGDNNASLPGLGSLTGGTASGQNGTIMSYCHLRSGGFANIANTFGKYHPYGRAAYRVSNRMLAHVQDSTACMDLDYVGSDLRVVKDCKPDDPMLVGQTALCTITVENLGPNMAQGALVVDTLLSNGTFTIGTISVTKNGTAQPADICTTTTNPQVNSGTVTCNLDLLDSGHKAVIVVPVSGGAPQNINDRVVVSSDSPDTDESNNIAEDEVNIVQLQADLAITKLCKPDTGAYYAGQGNLPFCEILVTNLGPDQADGVSLVDRIVASGEYSIASVTPDSSLADNCVPSPGIGVDATSSTVTCTLTEPLPHGGKWKVRVTYEAVERTDINDEATVTSSETHDPNPNNNVATGGVHVEPAADLTVSKFDDVDPVTAGEALTYTILVENDGPSTAVNAKMTDALPAGLTLQSVVASVGACVPGEPGNIAKPTVCSFGNLGFGSSATVTISVLVEPDARGVLVNSAVASSDTFEPDQADNTDSETTTIQAETELEVTKSDSPDPVVAGANLYYTLHVVNHGPSTATDVELVDTLPADVSFVTGVNGNGQTVCALNPGNIAVCDLGDLEPGEDADVFLTVLVDPSTPSGTVLTNSVTVTSVENPTGANDSEQTTVTTEADVWIDKTQNYPTGNPSGGIIYELTAYNRPDCEKDDQLTCWMESGGPSDAHDVVIVDPLPWTPKTFIVQYVSPGCSYDRPTHTVTCNAGTLEAGQHAAFRIEADIKGSRGTRDNTAIVSTSTPDPRSDNDTDTVTTTVKGSTGKGGRGGK